jgi:purine-binding chemotaxis protein CheW
VSRAATLFEAIAVTDEQLDLSASAELALDGQHVPEGQRHLLLTIASGHYAVLEAFVTELERVPAITAVPHVPAWVRGVTNLRGDILSVIDMRTFLGLESTSPHTARMLVVRLLGEEFSAGLLVDAVDRIVAVPPDEIRPPESVLDESLTPYVSGVCAIGERLAAVLDLEALLRSPIIRQFEEPTDEPQ